MTKSIRNKIRIESWYNSELGYEVEHSTKEYNLMEYPVAFDEDTGRMKRATQVPVLPKPTVLLASSTTPDIMWNHPFILSDDNTGGEIENHPIIATGTDFENRLYDISSSKRLWNYAGESDPRIFLRMWILRKSYSSSSGHNRLDGTWDNNPFFASNHAKDLWIAWQAVDVSRWWYLEQYMSKAFGWGYQKGWAGAAVVDTNSWGGYISTCASWFFDKMFTREHRTNIAGDEGVRYVPRHIKHNRHKQSTDFKWCRKPDDAPLIVVFRYEYFENYLDGDGSPVYRLVTWPVSDPVYIYDKLPPKVTYNGAGEKIYDFVLSENDARKKIAKLEKHIPTKFPSSGSTPSLRVSVPGKANDMPAFVKVAWLDYLDPEYTYVVVARKMSRKSIRDQWCAYRRVSLSCLLPDMAQKTIPWERLFWYSVVTKDNIWLRQQMENNEWSFNLFRNVYFDAYKAQAQITDAYARLPGIANIRLKENKNEPWRFSKRVQVDMDFALIRFKNSSSSLTNISDYEFICSSSEQFQLVADVASREQAGFSSLNLSFKNK